MLACSFQTMGGFVYRMIIFITCLIYLGYCFYICSPPLDVSAHGHYFLTTDWIIQNGPPLYQIYKLNFGYSAREFQALQLLLLVAFGGVDEPLASCMVVLFWDFVFQQGKFEGLIAVSSLIILLKLDLSCWFFSLCNLEIWWMTLKNIGHLFCTTSSFVHHFKSIGECKLNYSLETLNLGQNWQFFCPLWLWNLMDDLEKQQGTSSMLH